MTIKQFPYVKSWKSDWFFNQLFAGYKLICQFWQCRKRKKMLQFHRFVNKKSITQPFWSVWVGTWTFELSKFKKVWFVRPPSSFEKLAFKLVVPRKPDVLQFLRKFHRVPSYPGCHWPLNIFPTYKLSKCN